MEDPNSDESLSIKEVEVTVPKTDDPTIPVMTFRMWVLGIASCVLLSFVNQFMWYRKNPMTLSSISAQIAVVPLGHLMARTLTNKVFFKGTKWEFSLNPGPFNIKEHVLITIFANAGAGTVYATHILSSVKLLYKRNLTFLPAAIVMLTTQILGFGWAGLFRKYLVGPPEMWWPANLVQVSLFRALHEKEKRGRGAISRTQFFIFVLVSSAAYCIIPSYLATIVTSVSWLCWISPKSVLVNQVGSGVSGLGVGSFGADWATITSYLGTPLASPWFATANIAVGYALFMYVIVPFCYWSDIFGAKTYPIYSNSLFMSNGTRFDINSIINSKFQLDKPAYARTGPINLSTMFTMTYGVGFATLSATVVHVALFNGRDLWMQAKGVLGGKNKRDIHTELMKAYKPVPMWWFHLILLLTMALIIFATEYYKDTLQLPWWGVLLACGIALFFTLPIGIITATTNQVHTSTSFNSYTSLLCSEKNELTCVDQIPGLKFETATGPVANMCFKVYGYISMVQGLYFLGDFKLGHYMKIPPRSMFTVQVIGAIISVGVYTGTAWWLMEAIPHLCDASELPPDSAWTCPMDVVFFDASVIWGLVGPRRIFGNLGHYSTVNWFFLGGGMAPVLVWGAAKLFPTQKWITYIHLPVLLGATSMIPPAMAVNYTSWILAGFISGFVIYRYHPKWWERYNYILSGGLDAGTAFMTILIFFCLQYGTNIGITWIGNNGEGCPLARCPTAKGVVADGCPVF
ncbi:hypothetical protein V2J09_016602 [Rumex salicifolius]